MADAQDGWETISDPTDVPAEIRKSLGVAGVRKALGIGTSGSDAAPSGGAKLPAWAASPYEAQIGIYAGLKGAKDSFKDDFGGNTLTGGLENTIQGAFGGFGTEGQRDWWAQFKANDNVIRNKLFGAALTPSEQKAYEATTIAPSMDPGEIRRNLASRAAIVQKALARKTKFLRAQGYNGEAIDALAGEYAPDFNPDLNKQQQEGGDPASGVAGATGGSGTPPSDPNAPPRPDGELTFNDQLPQESAQGKPLTDEQRAALQAVAQSGGTAAQITALGQSFGVNITAENADALAKFYSDPKNRNVAPVVNEDRTVKPVDAGDGALGAAARGAGNALTLGFLDEAGALADTVTQGGTYGENLDKRRGQELFDEQNSGIARFAGQAIGSLPLGGVEFAGARGASLAAGRAAVRGGASAAEARVIANRVFAARTAAEAAGIGGVYGFGDAQGGAGERLGGAAIGAATGAALGGGLALGGGRFARAMAARRGAAAIPQPRASAVAYQEAQDLGINAPLGGTGNRAAAIVDQTLSNMTGSANVMATAGGQVRDQVEGAVRTIASQYGNSGGTFANIGEAAQRGARAWIDKFNNVASNLYNAIPISPNAQTTTNNAQNALDGMLGRFQSNSGLASIFKNNELQSYREALNDDVSWQDLKDFRSVIGEKIGEARFGEGAAKSDLRALYGALSEDMKTSAAAQGPKALRAFERANNTYRDGQERIEKALTKLVGEDGKQSPEKAGAFIDRISQGNRGGGDVRLLKEVLSSLPAAERGEVAGSMVSLIGQPANSQGRQFSVETFTRRYQDMAPEAKNALFGAGEHREDLEKFVRVSKRLADAASVRNTSNTAGQVLSGLAFYSLGNLPALMGQVASSYGAAKLITNPKFVKWATGYNRMMAAAVNSGKAPAQKAIASQGAFLTRIARAEPAIANDVLALQSRLADAFGAAPARLAAQPGTNEGAPVQRQQSDGESANQRLQP